MQKTKNAKALSIAKSMACYRIMLCFRLLYVIVLTSNVYDARTHVCVCVCVCACVCLCVLVCGSFVLFSAMFNTEKLYRNEIIMSSRQTLYVSARTSVWKTQTAPRTWELRCVSAVLPSTPTETTAPGANHPANPAMGTGSVLSMPSVPQNLEVCVSVMLVTMRLKMLPARRGYH